VGKFLPRNIEQQELTLVPTPIRDGVKRLIQVGLSAAA
jgi:hypothetical protein